MSADALLTWGARASAGMVLTKWPNKMEYSISGIRRVNSLIAVEYFAQTRPILHLLMPWQLMSPGYQQASHWPVRCAGFYHRCGSISTVCVSSVLKNNIKYKYFHFFKILLILNQVLILFFWCFSSILCLLGRVSISFRLSIFVLVQLVYTQIDIRYLLEIKYIFLGENEYVKTVNHDIRIDKQFKIC